MTDIREKHYYAKSFSEIESEFPDQFKNKIICGDSEEVLKRVPSGSVDMVLTSPPYNFGMDYTDDEDSEEWELYFKKLFAIFRECIRVLKYGGRIIVNVQPVFSHYVPTHHIISDFFRKEGLIWKGEVIWNKNNYNCAYTAWGSYQSPSSPYLKYKWEFIEIFCKGTLKHYGNSQNIDISKDEFEQWVVAEWSIAPETRTKKFGHPAMFPEELAERAMKLFSYRGDIILDPFAGVGTTAFVARDIERTFMCIDKSEKYCRRAIDRMGLLYNH